MKYALRVWWYKLANTYCSILNITTEHLIEKKKTLNPHSFYVPKYQTEYILNTSSANGNKWYGWHSHTTWIIFVSVTTRPKILSHENEFHFHCGHKIYICKENHQNCRKFFCKWKLHYVKWNTTHIHYPYITIKVMKL